MLSTTFSSLPIKNPLVRLMLSALAVILCVLYSTHPRPLNLFMKWVIRGRVVPTISARIS